MWWPALKKGPRAGGPRNRDPWVPAHHCHQTVAWLPQLQSWLDLLLSPAGPGSPRLAEAAWRRAHAPWLRALRPLAWAWKVKA